MNIRNVINDKRRSLVVAVCVVSGAFAQGLESSHPAISL